MPGDVASDVDILMLEHSATTFDFHASGIAVKKVQPPIDFHVALVAHVVDKYDFFIVVAIEPTVGFIILVDVLETMLVVYKACLACTSLPIDVDDCRFAKAT